MNYRELSLSDYDHLISLWLSSDGVQLRDADSKEGIEKYLFRNPGLSFVAVQAGVIVGSIMAGHDGKRGYIQHLAVAKHCRRAGVASELVRLCLAALEDEGILKSHIHILAGNESAKAFWYQLGWQKREDIEVFSFINAQSDNV